MLVRILGSPLLAAVPAHRRGRVPLPHKTKKESGIPTNGCPILFDVEGFFKSSANQKISGHPHQRRA
jgi:hypothetical protein